MRFMASTNKPRVSLEDGLWLSLLGIALLAGWRIMSADPVAKLAASGTGDSHWGGWLADLGLCVALVAAVGATGYVRYRAGRHRSTAEHTQDAGAGEPSRPGIDGALLSAMSHDLRTPMTGILGALELLGYSELNEHQRMLLLSAENASRTLQRMLDDVLNLARLEVIGPAPGASPFDLRDLLAQEAAFWSEDGTEMSVAIAGHLGSLLVGYGEGVKQASNALWRYAVLNHNGPLRLHVDVPQEGDDWQQVEWRLEAGDASPDELSIRKPERGACMERELARRLVDRWCERAGLSWWESHDGERIHVGMKGRFERDRHGMPDIHEDAGDDTPSRVVLVAEDNEIVRAMLGRQLELLGWEYDLVNDGVEAFEAWSRKRYAMLLTDCQMPGMDGIELTRRIRAGEKRRQLPIVALTANPSPTQRELCLQAGIDDVLSKSMRGSLLAGKLQSWLKFRRGPGDGSEPSACGMPRQADADQVRTRMNEVFGESASLLEEYLGTMRQEQAYLQSGIAAGDTARLRQVSHSLNGMSAFFGASSLSDVAASVERSESAIDVIHYARKLHACIDEFIDWVRVSPHAEHIFPTSTRNISEGSHRTI